MEDLEFSSSDWGRRYSQYSTSFDSADWRSNSMNESTGLNAGWLGSCSSYVRVEHSDAEITGGSSRAVNSWCSAEHPELQADLADQNLQQQSPSYPNRQNSLHTNQFDYMHLSTLAYDPQSEADHQSNTDDRKEYWARRSEPDYFAHLPPIPTPDAEYSNDFHLLYSVPDVLNDQGQALPNSGIPYYTQPVYPEEDLRGDIRLHYAGHTRESNNGACSHQHLVAEDVNGPWSTVNPQNNCPRHLEQQMNRILDVINASDSSPSTRDGSNEQQWGEASDVTVRPDNAQQSHQSGHSNASRHPLPTQHQAGLLISRDLAIIPNGPRSLPIRTRSPSMRSIDNNRRPPIPASNTPASPSSAQSNVVRCPVCSAQFEGIYAQGNCGRHRRLKHAVQKKEYPCEHSTCGKSYQRSDARLKHYRKYHPELIGCAV